MTAATATKPTLLEVLLDALHDGYWYQKGEVEGCGHCRRSPGGVCADRDHQEANARALEYDAARKQIERSPGVLDRLVPERSNEGSEAA